MAPRTRTTPTKNTATADPSAPAAPRKRRTTRSSSTPPTTETPTGRGATRRSAGITIDSDADRFGTPPTPPPTPPPAEQPPPPEQAPAKTAATPEPRQPARKKPWERELDEPKVAISVRLPKSLKARLDGLADHLALHHTDLPDLVADLGTQTEIFNLALHRLIAAAEDEINAGKPFPILIRRGR